MMNYLIKYVLQYMIVQILQINSNKIDIQMQRMKNVQKKSAFLLKTYEILQNTQYEQIVAWHHDGIGFVIHNIQKFTQKILPLYFKHSNFASFIRQLNMYGFSKKKSIKSENYYYHCKFQKSQKQLIKDIQRKMEKKSGNKNTIRVPQSVEDPRICSELSIQLQSKNENVKKIVCQPIEKQMSSKLSSLISVNQTLINSQFSSFINIFKDLNSLQSLGLTQEPKEEIKSILTHYISTHYSFLCQIKQKMEDYAKKTVSLSKLETQENLKEKKQATKDTKAKDQANQATHQSIKKQGSCSKFSN